MPAESSRGSAPTLLLHREVGFVERDLQASRGQHPGADPAEAVRDAEQSDAKRGAQQQKRQQVHRIHPVRDDQ